MARGSHRSRHLGRRHQPRGPSLLSPADTFSSWHRGLGCETVGYSQSGDDFFVIFLMFIFPPAQHLFHYLPKVRSCRVGAVKLAHVQLLGKSELRLPSSRLPERLRVLQVRCFRSLSHILLLVLHRPGFWARLCSLVSLCAPFLRGLEATLVLLL